MNEQTPFDMTPIDTIWHWKKIFQVLRPTVCMIARHGFWPGFMFTSYCYARTVPFDVFVRSNTSTFSLTCKKFLFKYVDFVFTTTAKDPLIFEEIDHIMHSGNTKFERIKDRLKERENQSTEIEQILSDHLGSGKRFIVGSAWQEDVTICLNAFQAINKKEPGEWKLILVPHDISQKSTEQVLQKCNSRKIRYRRLRDTPAYETEVLIVDEVGSLFEMYQYCSLAMIGGGFKQGIHNIIEAIVHKIPVSSGPLIGSDAEAVDYHQEGLLHLVHNEKQLTDWWLQRSVFDPGYEDAITKKIQQDAGATEKILTYLNHWIYEDRITCQGTLRPSPK